MFEDFVQITSTIKQEQMVANAKKTKFEGRVLSESLDGLQKCLMVLKNAR